MNNKFVPWLVIALLIVLMSVQGASATDITACGDIFSGGYYTITQNLDAGGGSCIGIRANNIVIEGNGFNITGHNPITNDYGIWINTKNNTSISNISNITGFSSNYGIGLLGRTSNTTLKNIASDSGIYYCGVANDTTIDNFTSYGINKGNASVYVVNNACTAGSSYNLTIKNSKFLETRNTSGTVNYAINVVQTAGLINYNLTIINNIFSINSPGSATVPNIVIGINGTGILFDNNSISGNYGIVGQFLGTATISNNSVTGNSNHGGFYLRNNNNMVRDNYLWNLDFNTNTSSNNNTVTNNTIEVIELKGGINNTIIHNTVTDNSWGWAGEYAANDVYGNNVSYNIFTGNGSIELSGERWFYNNIISHNIFNTTGIYYNYVIYVSNASGNIFENNTILNGVAYEININVSNNTIKNPASNFVLKLDALSSYISILDTGNKVFYTNKSNLIQASPTNVSLNVSGIQVTNITLTNSFVVPVSGLVSMNISTWNTTGDYYKKFNVTGTVSVNFTIGDLTPSNSYNVLVNGTIWNTSTSNSTGYLPAFNYTLAGETLFEVSPVTQSVTRITGWATIRNSTGIDLTGLIIVAFLVIIVLLIVMGIDLSELAATEIITGAITIIIILFLISILLGSLAMQF